MATLLEVSERIYQSLGSPDSPTVGVIQYYLRHNIGALNTLLNTSYLIDATDGTVEPDLAEDDAVIFQSMYFIYYYDTRVRANLGAASIDSILEVAENGAVVRMTNRNSLALTYVQMKKQDQENLNNMVAFYRSNRAVPDQVVGEDDVDVLYSTNYNLRRTINNL